MRFRRFGSQFSGRESSRSHNYLNKIFRSIALKLIIFADIKRTIAQKPITSFLNLFMTKIVIEAMKNRNKNLIKKQIENIHSKKTFRHKIYKEMVRNSFGNFSSRKAKLLATLDEMAIDNSCADSSREFE